MSSLGIYLNVTLDGSVIAETTSVEFGIEAVKLDVTTQGDALNSKFIQGNMKMAIAGGFLLASSAANWGVLFDLLSTGTQATILVLHEGRSLVSGPGVIKKLDSAGGISDSLCTGKYGIRFYVTSIGEGVEIITEDGFTIITEDGQTIITE